MKKYFLIIPLLLILASFVDSADAASLPARLKGWILLQVESHGEAWYVHPDDLKRYYLGRPADAFELMRTFGTGITDADLAKMPVGLIEGNGRDDDGDGLENSLESSLGTDPAKADSDDDGYSDKEEITKGYSPTGAGKPGINHDFTARNIGKIFLQVESHGEAWYVNPADSKRYYLGRPDNAFAIMRNLSLGVADDDLALIETGHIQDDPQETAEPLYAAADAIRSNDPALAASFFVPEMKRIIEYTMTSLSADSRLTLANILSGSTLSSSNLEEKIFSTEVFFSLGGYQVPVNFHVNLQPDGNWLISNL